MGPSNKALWNRCGISATRTTAPVASCHHPCAADTNRQLFFLADAPHVLNNIRGHLVRGLSFVLPDDTVAKYNLPTNEVSVEHIKALAEIDAARDLKLAPHLKSSYLDPSHFEKMNVASAVAVLNHSVGAAMRMLVCLGLLPPEALTTAWARACAVAEAKPGQAAKPAREPPSMQTAQLLGVGFVGATGHRRDRRIIVRRGLGRKHQPIKARSLLLAAYGKCFQGTGLGLSAEPDC
ncbi:hypothetical protein HPB47_025026 [Ixodes persulcatus]|uniref:Uncharacterized protein n=1 Tax=Ixodes persulcatus TaxID=34615 RepID=A0AC60Q301_IXOPE|nr:hypothetical protein HPB47_025026 [Ixodes persulcatus]